MNKKRTNLFSLFSRVLESLLTNNNNNNNEETLRVKIYNSKTITIIIFFYFVLAVSLIEDTLKTLTKRKLKS